MSAREDVSSGKEKTVEPKTELPTLMVAGSWEELFQGQARAALEGVLPAYMQPRRWFGSKARTLQAAEIVEAVAVGHIAILALVRVTYREGKPETYLLPLTFSSGERAEELRRERPQAVVALVQTPTASGILYDAVWENRFGEAVLELIAQQQALPGSAGEVVASATAVFPQLRGPREQSLPPALMGAEQSNTSIRYGDRLILKLFRRLEAGTNPDLEIGHFLTQKAAFAHIPPVAGALEYRRQEGGEPVTLAILQGFVPNQGDAWRYTLDSLGQYFERVRSQRPVEPLPGESPLELAQQDIPRPAYELIGDYLESAQLLGRRTAEMHLALASGADDPGFAPEAFTLSYQRRLHQDVQNLTGRIFTLLRQRLAHLPKAIRPEAQQVLELEPEILKRFHSLLERKISALRIRTHGDYHLGQVLYTGQDFMIIDFEGEPARSLQERRRKRSPWQDVAGMLRSFHYAAYAAFFEQATAEEHGLEAWIHFWHIWVSAAFLKTYLEVLGPASFHPPSSEEVRILLNVYLLEKAVYELGYELNNRPDWVKIPLQGIRQTL
ncbi:MAG: putative maltokinase [Anaerolineae bacterium]